jgi:ADP-ribosylglycohydrolase
MLLDKVYGCLLGGLIGDALGASVEGKSYEEIEQSVGWVEDFEGSGTDDSAIKMILIDAILAHGGYVTADEFAASFLRNRKYLPLFFIPVRNMFHKVEAKLELPVYAGINNMQSSSTAMAISPMGLINACDPRQAALETYDVAGLVHAGVSTFCRDGACAMAAAIAEAMNPQATVETVLEASTAYLHQTSSREMTECIKRSLQMVRKYRDYKAFRRQYYRTNLRDVQCDSRETVPCALALFCLTHGDPAKAIVYGANFGRDTDTIGTMVGALAGAFKGAMALKAEWIAKVESGYGKKQSNSQKIGPAMAAPDQRRLAHDLVQVIWARSGERKRRLEVLQRLLSR